MSKKINTPGFNFIKDEPLSLGDKEFFNFYHSSLAPALTKIIKSPNSPREIGIFGSWGTGKSTIIKMLQADKDLSHYPIFVFDAWKYQDDALRRTFLIEFHDFLKNEVKVKDIPKDFLEDFYFDKSKEIETKPQDSKDKSKWNETWSLVQKNILLVIFLGVSFICLLFVLFFNKTEVYRSIGVWLKWLSSFSFLIFLGKELLGEYVSQMSKILAESKQSSSIGRVTTLSKNRLNSPEEFEDKFNKLLSLIRNRHVIIVFDNIDRVPAEVAISMLSTIKTFMEPRGKSKVISLIPCDPTAISKRVVTYYGSREVGGDLQESQDMADEYLRKIFNLILWLPDYISSDLEHYTREKLKETGEISSLTLRNDDVVMVICSAYRKNPRDIIQFINNLTALIIAAHHSPVKEYILENVAYLAKVQVIRQKFPKSYEILQEKWNSPEEIAVDGDKSKDFLLSTNRITVSDAEPFIFFKSPLSTFGLSTVEEIKEALLSGDYQGLRNLASTQDKEALTRLVQAMLKKYRNMDKELVNIYNVQFYDIYGWVPEELKASYNFNLAKLVDSDLWRNYSEMDIKNTLLLLTQDGVRQDLQSAITTRCMQSIDPEGGFADAKKLEFSLNIIAGMIKFPKLFTTEDKDKAKHTIQTDPILLKSAVPKLQDTKEGHEYITHDALTNFFGASASTEIISSTAILVKYKSNIIESDIQLQILDIIKSKYEEEHNRDAGYSEVKNNIASALRTYITCFKDHLPKTQNPTLEVLASLISNCIETAPDSKIKENNLRALWIIRPYISEDYRSQSVSYIEEFISASGKLEIESLFDNWSRVGANKVIRSHFKSSLFSKAISDIEVGKFLLSLLEDDLAIEILVYAVENTSIDLEIDSQLIGFSNGLTNTSPILDAIFAKINNSHFESRYYDSLKVLVRRSSNKESKDKLSDFVTSRLTKNDITDIDIGINLLASQYIRGEDHSRIVSSLCEDILQLETPYDDIDLHKISFLFTKLDHISKVSHSTIITNLFSMFEREMPTALADKTMDILASSGNINFSTEATLISNAFNSIKSWPTLELRNYVLLKFDRFKSPRQSPTERKFWIEVATYTADDPKD
jgi:hypothetical protein